MSAPPECAARKRSASERPRRRGPTVAPATEKAFGEIFYGAASLDSPPLRNGSSPQISALFDGSGKGRVATAPAPFILKP
jgi:hypothetical protein